MIIFIKNSAKPQRFIPDIRLVNSFGYPSHKCVKVLLTKKCSILFAVDDLLQHIVGRVFMKNQDLLSVKNGSRSLAHLSQRDVKESLSF